MACIARFPTGETTAPIERIGPLNVVSATNPNTFLTQVEYIRFADGRPMHLDSIWGLVISGIPYVRLPKGAVTKPLTSFAGLRVRGLIGYYNYEVVEEEMVEIQAYDPVTGVPFRKGKVKKQSKTLREFMIHFERGETQVFDRENLMYPGSPTTPVWRKPWRPCRKMIWKKNCSKHC